MGSIPAGPTSQGGVSFRLRRLCKRFSFLYWLKQMSDKPNYVAYVDLLGSGDASAEDSQSYHDHLRRFRIALCDAVDRHLLDSDKVFAFSDCAFASSRSLQRVGRHLVQLQYLLWEHNIFLKGAITIGKPEHYELDDLEKQTEDLLE